MEGERASSCLTGTAPAFVSPQTPRPKEAEMRLPMRMYRILAPIAAIALLTGALVACGGDGDDSERANLVAGPVSSAAFRCCSASRYIPSAIYSECKLLSMKHFTDCM